MKLFPFLLIVSLGLCRLSAAEPQKATFAAGCFWCVEAIYEHVPGVLDAVSGYAGGDLENPTYRNHGDHTEAVDVTFDPDKVSYEELLRIFWKSHDATDPRGVSPDFGRSYRPMLFYRDQEQLAAILKIKEEVQKGLKKPVATEIVRFEKFWLAEDYHQDFERRNPDHPYIRSVSIPRLKRTLGRK